MKIRIQRLSVSQCAKMVAALYFVFSLPLLLVFMLLAPLLGQARFGIGTLIFFPFLHALVSYLGGVLCFWIYNLVAHRVGGFEYTAAEITS